MKPVNTSFARQPQINHSTRTINVTATFKRAASIYGTEACNLLSEILKAFPGYNVVCATPRKSTAKKVKLTYKKMEKYISCLRNGEVYLEIFKKVKAFAAVQDGAYFIVSSWFNTCFPDYGCVPEFDEDGFPQVEANVISFEDYKQQREVAAHHKQSNNEQLSATSEHEQSESEQREAI